VFSEKIIPKKFFRKKKLKIGEIADLA